MASLTVRQVSSRRSRGTDCPSCPATHRDAPTHIVQIVQRCATGAPTGWVSGQNCAFRHIRITLDSPLALATLPARVTYIGTKPLTSIVQRRGGGGGTRRAVAPDEIGTRPTKLFAGAPPPSEGVPSKTRPVMQWNGDHPRTVPRRTPTIQSDPFRRTVPPAQWRPPSQMTPVVGMSWFVGPPSGSPR